MSSKLPDAYFLWELTSPPTPRLVGELHKLTNGDVSLQYDAEWRKNGYALSPDLPLNGIEDFLPVHRRGREKAAPGAVEDARPDQWGEKVIRYLHKPKGGHLLDFLYFAGDDRFGALGVSSSAKTHTPSSTPVLPRLEDAQAISETARIIQADGQLTEQQAMLAAANASLGGAKPKAVINIDGEEWVLKLFNGEHVDQPLVEHATMTLANRCGITVATTMPVRLPDQHAVAVKRFDREGGTNNRIHSISASTVIRAEHAAGSVPVYGYPHLARSIRRSVDADLVPATLLELFRRMVFNVLIGNTDDHERNHAFLVRQNGKVPVLHLAPAYDVVPTGSGAVEHEFMISEDSREPLLSNCLEVCQQFGLTPEAATHVITEIVQIINGWHDHFSACGVSDRDIAELESIIDSDSLLGERLSFGKTPATKSKPKRRSGPFE